MAGAKNPAGKKTPVGDMETITVRMSPEMVREIDEYVDKQKKQNLGSPYTRSDAIRNLLRDAILAKREKAA